jgi:hypothetical protein
MGNRTFIAVVASALLIAAAGPVTAQEASAGRPEVVPTPVPQSAGPPSLPYQPDQPSPPYQPYQPGAAYDPIRAAEDAYRMAEEARQAVFSRQLQLQERLRAYGVWNPTPYRYALPYIYAYAPPRVARRVVREMDRWTPPVALVPVPPLPGGAYRYPYSPSPWIGQPQGNGQAQTGPNAYAFRAPFAQPRQPQPPANPGKPQGPTPARPETRPSPPAMEVPAEPAPADPIPPAGGPEIIPAPPSEPGPREF